MLPVSLCLFIVRASFSCREQVGPDATLLITGGPSKLTTCYTHTQTCIYNSVLDSEQKQGKEVDLPLLKTDLQ